MANIDSNLQCPACKGPLLPKVLECGGCHVRVEGPFQWNEFATLESDDLHFLRIFLRCEGRIRDMEPALGLSYPTIRTRLTALKDKLAGLAQEQEADKTPDSVPEILAQLEKGKISFDDAMARIKKVRTI